MQGTLKITDDLTAQSVQFRAGGREVLRVNADGTIWLNPDLPPNESAREAYDALLAMFGTHQPKTGTTVLWDEQQALRELLSRLKLQQAPTRLDLIGPGHRIATIGIGTNHHATLLIDDDALAYLAQSEGVHA